GAAWNETEMDDVGVAVQRGLAAADRTADIEGVVLRAARRPRELEVDDAAVRQHQVAGNGEQAGGIQSTRPDRAAVGERARADVDRAATRNESAFSIGEAPGLAQRGAVRDIEGPGLDQRSGNIEQTSLHASNSTVVDADVDLRLG